MNRLVFIKYKEGGENKTFEIPEGLSRAISFNLAEKEARAADAENAARKMATTWKQILKLLDLEGKSAAAVMLAIPKIISQIQRQPEMFNFISPELNELIEKYAEK